MRRWHAHGWGLVLAMVTAIGPVWAQSGQPPLTVVSWGGAYTRAQMMAVVRPYRETSGDWVAVEQYRGGLDEIEDQVASLNVTWDVVDLNLPDAIRACDQGLLEPIDPSTLAPPADGGSVVDDFFDKTLQPCAVGQVVFATVVAYPPRAFGSPPTSIADLFDPRAFPGRRALRRTPRVNLEWALLADGVPAEEIYDVLETSRGVDRAFHVLDRIARDVVWWRDLDTPTELLSAGQVTMASGANGRITNAVEERGADLEILWDANAWDGDFWGIVRGTDRLEEALDFVRFATAPEQLAGIAEHIAYGPVRRSAMAEVDPERRPLLPTSKAHAAESFRVDYAWWARHEPRLTDRFEAWLAAKSGPVYDFDAKDRS